MCGGAASAVNVAPPSVDRNSAAALATVPAASSVPVAVRANAIRVPLSKESGTATVAPPLVASASASPVAPSQRSQTRSLSRGSIATIRTCPAPSAAVRSASCQLPPPSLDRASVGAAAAPLESARSIVIGSEAAISRPVTRSPGAPV
jgi:hypothetical protein